MIKVGKILIDPNSIDTILLEEPKGPRSKEELGVHKIQIIYKSGVVKNITSQEVGMGYYDFIDQIIELEKKAEDRKLLKLMAALNNKTNG